MLNLVNKTIAVDICNTLADVLSELEARLGKFPNPNSYFHPALMDNPHYFEENLDIFLSAKPIGNSAQILRELSKFNKIVYITARPKAAELVTKVWLRNNGYPKAKIYFTDNKVKVAKSIGVDIAIDDSPSEIESYMDAGIQVIVKQQDYNVGYFNRFDWDNIANVSVR
jgi:5'(3')-deoxyribonucleotidase